MKTIILAGGKATRLPISAKDIPKILVLARGKPILEHQLDLLKFHGLFDVRLSLYHFADKVIDYLEKRPKDKMIIDYVVEEKPLGTGGGIKFASKGLNEEFAVFNGDNVSNFNLTEFIKNYERNKPRGIMGSIGLFHWPDISDMGYVNTENELIISFKEKTGEKISGHINAGFYILHPEIFKDIEQENFSIEHDVFVKLPPNSLSAYIHSGFWHELGTEERLKEFNESR